MSESLTPCEENLVKSITPERFRTLACRFDGKRDARIADKWHPLSKQPTTIATINSVRRTACRVSGVATGAPTEPEIKGGIVAV
jgi:hypothetical protein